MLKKVKEKNEMFHGFVVAIIFAEWPKEGSVGCPGALLAASWNIVITWQQQAHTLTWLLSTLNTHTYGCFHFGAVEKLSGLLSFLKPSA